MEFSEYQKKAYTTAIYPKKMKVVYPALGLSGEVGEVCEKIKKVFRDKNGVFATDVDIVEIKKEIGDVLWYISALASDLGINLEDIAQENLNKLADRKNRGKLSGSGDNR